jgi:hypothetical protein
MAAAARRSDATSRAAWISALISRTPTRGSPNSSSCETTPEASAGVHDDDVPHAVPRHHERGVMRRRVRLERDEAARHHRRDGLVEIAARQAHAADEVAQREDPERHASARVGDDDRVRAGAVERDERLPHRRVEPHPHRGAPDHRGERAEHRQRGSAPLARGTVAAVRARAHLGSPAPIICRICATRSLVENGFVT